MPDKEFDDSNIFNPGLSSFNAVIDRFRRLSELAAPLKEINSGGFRLFTIPLYDDKNLRLLPVFTDSRALKPPFAIKFPLEFLKLLFHSQSPGSFSFNPSGSGAAEPEIRIDRLQLSLIIGALEAGPVPDNTPLAAGPTDTHMAHYLASRLPAGPAADLLKAEALVLLDMCQEAYRLIRGDRSPRALCLLATIYRKTGDIVKARETISSIPKNEDLGRRNELEAAWIELHEGKTAEARRIFTALADDRKLRQEALFGLAMSGPALSAQSPASAGAGETSRAFETALETPSRESAKIFFYAGNFFLRSGSPAKAEYCYRQSAGLFPSIPVRANLCLTLLRESKTREAAAVAAGIALTEPAAAWRLAAHFPKESAPALFESTFQAFLKNRPDSAPPATPEEREKAAAGESIVSLAPATPKTALTPEKTAPSPSGPAAPFRNPSSMTILDVGFTPQPSGGTATPQKNSGASPEKQAAEPAAGAAAPLTPATPRSGAGPALEGPVTNVQMETFKDVMAAPGAAPEEIKKDSFLSLAFKLASDLEDEFGEKIYFNADGLTQAERKLRLTFIKGGGNQQDLLETVKDCSAFLCYVLQERLSGRLLQFSDFDPWGWPMIFEQPAKKVTTYPVERVWRLLWKEALPEPGWLAKYMHYLEGELKAAPGSRPQGADAVRLKIMSQEEKITEAQTEHKRILILASTLDETCAIETGRGGIQKLEQILRNSFRPSIPPTADGWKLLRCYGHLFTSLLVKDFKASWYNVDGGDGLWSMRTPWRTFIFPIGKVYKAASAGESLLAYYDQLEAEKMRYATRES